MSDVTGTALINKLEGVPFYAYLIADAKQSVDSSTDGNIKAEYEALVEHHTAKMNVLLSQNKGVATTPGGGGGIVNEIKQWIEYGKMFLDILKALPLFENWTGLINTIEAWLTILEGILTQIGG